MKFSKKIRRLKKIKIKLDYIAMILNAKQYKETNKEYSKTSYKAHRYEITQDKQNCKKRDTKKTLIFYIKNDMLSDYLVNELTSIYNCFLSNTEKNKLNLLETNYFFMDFESKSKVYDYIIRKIENNSYIKKYKKATYEI